jgi:hypothetical protein
MTVKVITPQKNIVIAPYIKSGRFDGVHWITLSEITFEIDGVKFRIPPGFLTDMGSIPRIARMTVDRMGKSLVGFIIHDFLYSPDAVISRKVADKVLYEIGRQHGESWYTANKIYYAVRSFGGWAASGPNIYKPVSREVLEFVANSNGLQLVKES